MIGLATMVLFAINAHLADVLGMNLPQLQLCWCCNPLQCLADWAINDPNHSPDLVASNAVRQKCSILLYCSQKDHTSKLTTQIPLIISNLQISNSDKSGYLDMLNINVCFPVHSTMGPMDARTLITTLILDEHKLQHCPLLLLSPLQELRGKTNPSHGLLALSSGTPW